jgi:hypothetical protein
MTLRWPTISAQTKQSEQQHCDGRETSSALHNFLWRFLPHICLQMPQNMHITMMIHSLFLRLNSWVTVPVVLTNITVSSDFNKLVW